MIDRPFGANAFDGGPQPAPAAAWLLHAGPRVPASRTIPVTPDGRVPVMVCEPVGVSGMAVLTSLINIRIGTE